MKIRSILTLATLLLASAWLTACGSASSSGSTAPPTAAGKSVTILTDVQGLTLYYRTSDTATTVCSGGCAAAWPPVLLPQGTPAGASPLPGTLAITTNTNGRQVTYNGHPLYRFASDNGPGSTKGDGVAGVWFVATTGLS